MPGHGRLSACLLLVFATSAWSSSPTGPAAAKAQDLAPEEPQPFRGRGFGPFPHARGEEFRRPDLPEESTSTKGFLFLDGEYVAPPYEIRYAEGEVTVNGRKLTCKPTRNYYGMGYGGRSFGGGFGAGRSDPWRFLASELAQHLASDTVVMSFADQPLVVMASTHATYDLLKMLTRGSSQATNSNSAKVLPVSYLEQLPEDFDREVWDQFMRDFKSPHDLTQRGLDLVAAYDKTERDALSSIAATRRLNSLAYPLTVGLMVVTVLAVGHLLGGRPHANHPSTGIDDSPEMIRALNWSLLFVALLSVGDLTLTILASQAGQMREMNPLGSHLIHDPRHLFGFKVGATLPSLALLWLLRRHKRAQIAAWWICLILVIVTFRWLTVNAAFMSA